MGNGKMAERRGGRRDFFGDGGDGRPRGSPLPVLVGVRRDGSPHPRGQREGIGSRLRLHRGQAVSGGRGWVPASARIREGWIPVCVFTGASCEREGRGWVPASARTTGGEGFPPTVFAGAGCERGDGDGPPHPRGHGRDGFPPTVFASVGCERENGGIWTYLMTSRMMCPDEE